MNNYKSTTKKDKDWDGREPMTGAPMTGEVEEGETYNAGEIDKRLGYTPEQMGEEYTPEMRSSATNNTKPYDVGTKTSPNYTENPTLQNNTVNMGSDYTKQDSNVWTDTTPKKVSEKIAGADKNRSNRSYK